MTSNENSADALAELWAHWAEVCDGLSQEQWSLPTRCGAWNVAALAAHVSGGVSGLRALLDVRRTDGPANLRTAVELIRAVKPTSDVAEALADRVAAQAVDDASSSVSAELVERFRDGGDVCARAASQLDVAADYFGRGTATIGAAVDLRIVEAAVHLLDLQSALHRERAVPEQGMQITLDFLVGLVPPVDFLEAATGRQPVDFFPVHS